MNKLTLTVSALGALALWGCQQASDKPADAPETAPEAQEEAAPAIDISAALDAALAQQPVEDSARNAHRHPKETLEFFGIKPGMTVGEALPGGGWYSKILLPYLGPEGELVGVDYAYDMFPLFGEFATEEFMEQKKTWTTDWPVQAEPWRGENGAAVSAHTFSTLPEELNGTLDAFLFIRALHNLSRFDLEHGYMRTALENLHRVLKADGIVGVVQHRAPLESDDAWADGSNGYLKKEAVIAAFDAAGFDFVAESDINANPKDVPTSEDFVWRLPPVYAGVAEDDLETRAALDAIGESDRMTLTFRKR